MIRECVVGIDPGKTGAIAAIGSNGEVQIWDYPGDETSVIVLLNDLKEWGNPYMVVLEMQQAMPKQGVSSAFDLGVNFGGWRMAIAAFGWPHRFVRSAEWKKNLGYPAKVPGMDAAKRKKILKEHSLTLARQMYPQAVELMTRVKDHDRAEALLLAHYAKGLVWGGAEWLR